MSQGSAPEGTGARPSGSRPVGGIRWRVLLSILGPVAWISFTLLYIGFWADGFSLFQSVIVIIVSLLILAGLMGAMWASFGMRYHRRWDDW